MGPGMGLYDHELAIWKEIKPSSQKYEHLCMYACICTTYGATQWAAVKTCVSDIKLAPQYCPEPEFEGRSKAASQGQAFFSESMPPTTDSMGGGFFSKSERSLFVLFVNVNGLGVGNIIRVFLIPQPAKVKISSNSFSVTNSIFSVMYFLEIALFT